MTSIGDYNKIMSDHNIFNQIVYTPLSEAIRLLEERQKDPTLVAKIEELLNGDIPDILKEQKCGVLGRHIATPNYESRVFLEITRENGLFPVFFEYLNDKFTSNNNYKHSLGQLRVRKENPNKGMCLLEKINIIDFNIHNGKKIKEVETMWGENLLIFHRKLFNIYNLDIRDSSFIDMSNWMKNNGDSPSLYYTNFLLLFICHGVLFENFLVSRDKEGDFTRDVVLSALENVINITGIKPLIVPIPPMDMENDDFWYHHLIKIKEIIK